MSPEEWAFKIGELIKEAEADGLILTWHEEDDWPTLGHFGAYRSMGKWWVNGCEVEDPVELHW